MFLNRSQAPQENKLFEKRKKPATRMGVLTKPSGNTDGFVISGWRKRQQNGIIYKGDTA
jgi:hypothetical protein